MKIDALHLVPQTDSQCPLVRIRHQWWDTLSYGAATSVRRCSQSSSVLLWPSAPHRPLTRPLLCSTGLHLGSSWWLRRRIGRPRQSWLRTVEADLRPMNLGLATSKRRAQDRSAWRKLVTTATSTTSSWRRRRRRRSRPRSVHSVALELSPFWGAFALATGED